MKIIQADQSNITEVSRLFDLYRQFYECEPDLSAATNFISKRLENNESIIFLASIDQKAAGFVQMYPSFCSVDICKIFILYDLYVDSSARKNGIGEALMNRASDYARENDAKRVDLLTAFSNTPGQRLYEKLGYEKTLLDFHAYSLAL